MGSKRNIIGGSDGWLRIKVEPQGEIVSVPHHLQVELSSTTGGRDFFTVLEGVHRGKRCSVKAGNLSPGAVPLRKAVRLVFDKTKGTVTCGELRVGAMTAPHKPIPDGEHPIQIPDFPHSGGRNYLSDSPYAKNWFFLGHGSAVQGDTGGDRYLHPGMISAGCITVEPESWTALYEQIIKCRSNDGTTIGSITVRK